MDPFEAQRRRGVALSNWMHRPAEVREAETRECHRRWLSMLSERDWGRIRDLAREVKDGYEPARLEDLDAKGLAVGVCEVGSERWCSGERVGTVRGGEVAVLVWEK